MNSWREQASIAASLLLAACSTVSPADVRWARPALWVPVQQWAGRTAATMASPTPGPVASGSASPEESPSPKPRKPAGWFVPLMATLPVEPGGVPSFAGAQLFVWDPATRESYLLPGAGVGVVNACPFGERGVLFSRVNGTVGVYDLDREVVISFPDVDAAGFVIYSRASDDARRIVLQVNPEGAGFGVSELTRAMLWDSGALLDLPAVNAIGAAHGGITETFLSGNGRVIAFSTVDQRVFLYRIGAGPVMEVVKARGAGDRCGQPALDREARTLAWLAGEGLLQVYTMPLEPTGQPGLGLRPSGPPRRVPEIAVENVRPEIVRVVPTELGLLIGIQRLDLGVVKVLRYEEVGGRVYLMATLNLFGGGRSADALYPSVGSPPEP